MKKKGVKKRRKRVRRKRVKKEIRYEIIPEGLGIVKQFIDNMINKSYENKLGHSIDNEKFYMQTSWNLRCTCKHIQSLQRYIRNL